MSFDTSSEKCAVCSAYLFSDDDVVCCPECGAPHHRECYNSIGHCGLQDLHGTKDQYRKPEQPISNEKKSLSDDTVFCSMCGQKYEKDEEICPSCNAPNLSRMGGRVVTIDFTGGVPDETDLGDGVTVNDAKKFVAVNTHRYMPKFAAFRNGKKLSWNWLALITPCGWLLSRKMYMLGAIIGALQVALTMLLIPFSAAVNSLDISNASNYMEVSKIVLDNISVIGITVFYTAFIGSLLDLILRVIFAMFGDLIYRKHVITQVKKIKHSNNDSIEVFREKGGINFFVALLGYFAVQYLPTIIAGALGIM